MNNHAPELELIANSLLEQNGLKPNYSNRDFMNAIIIFQSALMDKLFDNQNYIEMELNDRCDMAIKCGEELRALIQKFTSLDTHQIDRFL